MPMTAEGVHECDRCGVDLGNAGITEAATVSVLDADGNVVNLRLGLKHRCGCARAVLTPSTHAHYDKRKGPLKLHERPQPPPTPGPVTT